jgi:hypothetical protein
MKTYNPYMKILNFVLLIWEERNSGCYEHARACRERARAPRAPKKSTSPPQLFHFFMCHFRWLDFDEEVLLRI